MLILTHIMHLQGFKKIKFQERHYILFKKFSNNFKTGCPGALCKTRSALFDNLFTSQN